MHKVERNEQPDGLREKSIDFNSKINIQSIDITNAWKSFTSSKLKKQTVEQLNKVFKGCCAYCEGVCENTSYPEIEHFRPKSLYPQLMFDYNNMNIACTQCNKIKGEKFDDKLINPTVDNPEKHLKFETYLLVPLDERGSVTINMLRINKPGRTNRKEEKYKTVSDGLKSLKSKIDRLEKGNENATEILKEWISSTIKDVEAMFEDGFEYCTMYRDNFKNDIEFLKKKLIEIS